MPRVRLLSSRGFARMQCPVDPPRGNAQLAKARSDLEAASSARNAVEDEEKLVGLREQRARVIAWLQEPHLRPSYRKSICAVFLPLLNNEIEALVAEMAKYAEVKNAVRRLLDELEEELDQ
ncbi:uncharacterized protein FTOL_13276 [Fusarium torulosum]|uniref:Uncharacterized protein n=1 Tax=Fusarium torulosum TaxID=33205 RepID=A0AAE8SPN9_9HYPO|nr:uncharacterized protein FTOL_13276 [Fusarium torulosum]